MANNYKNSVDRPAGLLGKFHLSSALKLQLKDLLYLMYPLLFIGGITVMGALVVKWHYAGGAGQLEADEVMGEGPLVDYSHEAGQSALLDRYIDANGGMSVLRDLERFTFSGVVIDGGRRRMFSARKASAADAGVELQVDGLDFHLGFEGGRLVQGQFSLNGDEVDVGVASLAFTVGCLCDPFAVAIESGEGRIVSVEHEMWKGFRTVHVRFSRSDPESFSDVYLNESDLTVLARIETLPDGSSRSYRYSDYKHVEGVRMPHSVEVSLGTGHQSRIWISRIVAESRRGDSLSGGDGTRVVRSW